MKTYVLTISEFFPKTHKRAGELTNFPASIKYYDKIHTIRGNYELWEKRFKKINAGEAMLSVRIWEGKPYKSKQVEIFKYDFTHGIGIEKLTFVNNDFNQMRINEIYSFRNLFIICKNDGLNLADFREWFKKYDLSKPMAIIHFTDFRYSS